MPRIERLTGQDLTHLVADEAGWPGHIGVIAVLDDRPLLDDRGVVDIDRVRAAVAGRIGLVPRLRQRIAVAPLGLGAPLWVDATHFDPADHIRVHPVPDPGDEQTLLRAVEELRRRPFPPARPPWALWLLPGLSDGRVALYVKVHHAMADGTAGVGLLRALFGPDGPTGAAGAGASGAPPSSLELFRDNLHRRARAVAAAASAIGHPARTAARLRAFWPALHEVFGEERGAPCVLNRLIGPDRRMALLRRSLSATKDLAHAAGGTVNDVVLATLAGGLRDVLRARGEVVDGIVLRVSVPVSLRPAARAADGNLDGMMAVPVPVGEPDAAARLRSIAGDTAVRRSHARPQFFTGVLGSRPVQRLVLRLMRNQRMVNAYLANVVGPRDRLHVAGAPILEMFPVVPITANVTLGVGVLSYAGQLNLTVVADRDSWPDLPVFMDGLGRSWTDLTASLTGTELPATEPVGTEPVRASP